MKQIYLFSLLLFLSSCLGQKVTVKEYPATDREILVGDQEVILESPRYNVPDSLLHLLEPYTDKN